MLQQSEWGKSDPNETFSSGEEEDLDIQRALDRLEEKILDNFRIPLINKTLIDEDEILAQVDFIRVSLPVAIQKAEDLLNLEQTIIKQAEDRAAEIIGFAQQQAEQMTQQTEIYRQAEREADQIRREIEIEAQKMREEAQTELEILRQRTYQELEQLRQTTLNECTEIQTGADDYAYQVLNNLEENLEDMLKIIKNGRKQLTIDK